MRVFSNIQIRTVFGYSNVPLSLKETLGKKDKFELYSTTNNSTIMVCFKPEEKFLLYNPEQDLFKLNEIKKDKFQSSNPIKIIK